MKSLATQTLVGKQLGRLKKGESMWIHLVCFDDLLIHYGWKEQNSRNCGDAVRNSAWVIRQTALENLVDDFMLDVVKQRLLGVEGKLLDRHRDEKPNALVGEKDRTTLKKFNG